MEKADEIDGFVEREMERQKIPGLALAVVKDGKVVKAKGYGFANLEHGVAVKPDTVFQSGSVGKQFTAAGVLLLAADGKLSLDDPINRYLPDGPPAWSEITVRHLLQHTSGVPDYESKKLVDLRRDYSEEELVRLAARLPSDFAPGADWTYSNTGYVLLGIIIHKASGKFYGDYLQERIFRPLGMTTTRILSEADIIPNRAAGYRLVHGVVKNQEWVSPTLNTLADGSLYLTVLDLAKWDAALYTEQPLAGTMRETMWTPAHFGQGLTTTERLGGASYGCGWLLDVKCGHRVVAHSGEWQGFKSQITRYPADKLTVIVLLNLVNGDPNAIASGVARRVLPDLRGHAIPDPDPAVTKQLDDILTAAQTGKPWKENSATGDAPDWFPGLADDLKPWGAIQKAELVEAMEKDSVRRRRYRVPCEHGAAVVVMILDRKNQIVRVSAEPE